MLGLFDLLQKGSAVANPAAWKKGQITVDVVAAFLIALATFGKPWLPESVGSVLTSDILTALAVVIVGVVSPFITVASTEKVGL